jgi:hypothetical protein
MTLISRPLAKKVTLRRRHHCLCIRDRSECRNYYETARYLSQIYRMLPNQHMSRSFVHRCRSNLKRCIIFCLVTYQSLHSMESAIFWAKLPIVVRKYLQINHLSDSDSKTKFRFHSANDLRSLFLGLHFPPRFTSPRVGRIFSGEEVFLSGICLSK